MPGMDHSDRIADLLEKISNSRMSYTRSDSNLPAKLIKMEMDKSQSQSISSSYTSITKNGKTHQHGKRLINNSRNPFILVDEMEDGKIKHYYIPKNHIKNYKAPGTSIMAMMKSKSGKQDKKTKQIKKLVKKSKKTKQAKKLVKKSKKTKKSKN
jgi:hypothetical protein